VYVLEQDVAAAAVPWVLKSASSAYMISPGRYMGKITYKNDYFRHRISRIHNLALSWTMLNKIIDLVHYTQAIPVLGAKLNTLFVKT
jgi:uncharacterized membrane protein YpjA